MFYFAEHYGETQNNIHVTTEFLQDVFTQSRLSIENGSTAFNFMDEEFLKIVNMFSHILWRFPQMRKLKYIRSCNINQEFGICKCYL